MIEAHHTVSGGVGRITDQNPRQHFVGNWNDGVYYHPTLVSGVRRGDKIANTETFGPLVCMIEYETLEEAIEISNAHGYGLSAAIYTNDPREAWSFVRGNEAGMTSVCNTTSGAEAHLPFGGNGKSGNGGRQSGVWAVDEFTRWQSVNWDWAGKLQRAQMDNDNLTPDLTFTL
jgi:aldehyde dehydrogenase (NAD+)